MTKASSKSGKTGKTGKRAAAAPAKYQAAELPHPPRLTHAELKAVGKGLRDKLPRESHAHWKPHAGRADPLQLLAASNEGRIAELVPIRFGRMVRTPFTFFRGAALGMAADLATTPSTGMRVQACGDCHLMNFGAFATPERRLIFDINDMDETLPAPWEWDLKRLTASIVVACRNSSFSEAVARDAVLACARTYRERMAEFGEMPVLDVWYASIDAEQVMATTKDDQTRKRFMKRVVAARERCVREHDFPKLAAMAGKAPTIKDNPPLIYHPQGDAEGSLLERSYEAFDEYRQSIQEDRRTLLDRYDIKDVAMKVVGVGSVGTFCAVMLLMASENDPLFLQIKEARRSVLEPYAGKSLHANHGQRVVNGCRLIQSASDIFLGWTKGGANGRHFYVRQLRDMKLSPMVETYPSGVMTEYGALCGWTLARAHARSGEPSVISGYLGKGDTFDKAIAKFSAAYADQNERDHAVLRAAVQSSQVEATVEPD